MLYRPDSVEKTPEQEISNWSIMEVTAPEPATRHLVGSIPGRDGRVSSAIQSFDPASRIAVTRSGRRYKLAGEPGFSTNAEYVWNAWAGLNGVTESRDVTAEYTRAN